MVFRAISLLLICGSLVFTTGCMTAGKRVLKEVVGASSELKEVPATVKSNFRQHKNVTIAPIQSESRGLVSPGFKRALKVELTKALAKSEDAPFSSGTPGVTVEPNIMWYHQASGLGSIVGSDSFAVVLFMIQADGAEMARLEIVTTNAAATSGDKEMASSMAKTLAEWFKKKRQPKEGG